MVEIAKTMKPTVIFLLSRHIKEENNLLPHLFISLASFFFLMTSLKFKLKTIDPTEILLSRCIRAAEN